MIKMVVFDFDGVLTDNRVWVNQDGVETVACSRGDGWWLGELKRMGLDVRILSSETNPVVQARAKKLGIPAETGHKEKINVFRGIVEGAGLKFEEVAYVGNEINDLECMKIAGMAICPSDSHPEIKAVANVLLPVKGGMGVVWPIVERLRMQGKESRLNPDSSLVCVIPARGGSKGIPKKNLAMVGGRPLVDWSLDCAAQSGLFSKILLSSDDDQILERASHYGATPVRRPQDLSSDTATSESAVRHALEEGGARDCEAVFFLQPTSPLRLPSDLREGWKSFKEQGLDSLFSSCSIEDWFIWEEGDSGLESVTYDWKSRRRRQELKTRSLENGSFFIFKPSILFETDNRMGGKIGTYPMESWKGLQVDRPEELITADILARHRLVPLWD